MIVDTSISHFPETDAMAIGIHLWPEDAAGNAPEISGEDAGQNLVTHCAADGQPWPWEIVHASMHSEHVASAIDVIRRCSVLAAK